MAVLLTLTILCCKNRNALSKMLMSETPFPQKFYEGIEQFNRQEFFEAHETLESVWKERTLPDRIFIQGIIQIAVGCHHLRNGNLQGALSLFQRGLAKFEPFKPSYEKVDVEKLIDSILKLQALVNTPHSNDAIIWPYIEFNELCWQGSVLRQRSSPRKGLFSSTIIYLR
jgi:uncharacterized protein